ncbi:MAG: ABC transporter permease [Terracidiphilus sp.]
MAMRILRFGIAAARHAARIALVLALGAVLGATLVRLAPGFGSSEEDLDSRLSRESIEALRQQRAADENLAAYYLHSLTRLAHGDLGESRLLNQPVRQLLAERFPETLKSVAAGLALAWMLGFPLAAAAVMGRARVVDWLASLGMSLLVCIPAAVLALLFVIARAPARFAVGLIVLPKVFTYARGLLARSSEMPHVLAARARGAGTLRILLRHILPVSAPQLFALAGISLTLAFAAAVPVEALCDLPGIGQLAWKAAMERDLNLLVNLTMLVTLITVVANSAASLAGEPSRGGAR